VRIVPSNGCALESTFILLPASFCKTTPAGECSPYGIALDKSLNVYFVDVANDDVTECTNASHYTDCFVIESLYSFPESMFIDSSGNIWVSDSACSGYVWENGAVKFTTGEAMDSIAVSKTGHVYVGWDAFCKGGNAGIMDLTDGELLPTLLKGGDSIAAVTPSLQFTAYYNGTVYQTKNV